MLTILHTADLHLGHAFGQFDADTGRKLSRARLEAVDTILGIADQYDVAAVLCAGDTFDSPTPDEDWWKGLAAVFERRTRWQRPVVLLPGNHDPLKRDSVYERRHPFRRALPSWVHVVDRDDFELTIGSEAVVYARPCRSTAGADDLALALPSRAPGDERIRIGLIHGSTFDLPDFQTNFPISREAPASRGLDYLAIGDVHGFRIIAPDGRPAPIVYPGSPEPTRFGETEAGHVAVVTFRRRGMSPRIRKERVGRWTWREETVTSLAALRSLAAEHLTTTAMRIHLEMDVSVSEEDEVNAVLTSLAGTLPTRMNPDLTMGDELLKKTGAGNLFTVFGEPDVEIDRDIDGNIVVRINGLDVYDPTTGQIRSNSTDDLACWFIDTNYSGESFFVRHAYFTGADEPYEKLKRALRAEIDEGTWSTLYSTVSRPFAPPDHGRIAVKVINHYGDEVLKVFEV